MASKLLHRYLNPLVQDTVQNIVMYELERSDMEILKPSNRTHKTKYVFSVPITIPFAGVSASLCLPLLSSLRIEYVFFLPPPSLHKAETTEPHINTGPEIAANGFAAIHVFLENRKCLLLTASFPP